MPQTRPSAGDYSGKLKADAQHDAQQEQRDRSAEISLADAQEAEEQRTGVFSPHTQERMDAPMVVEEVSSPFEGNGYAPERPPAEQVFTGYETEEQMVPILASRSESPIPQAVFSSASVIFRVGQDIEDMTYGFTSQGYPNNMTFREGLIYEVDINVADHLNQRGLVSQWVS